ncbi:MAG: hypothetical protein V1866_06835 [archaeon]
MNNQNEPLEQPAKMNKAGAAVVIATMAGLVAIGVYQKLEEKRIKAEYAWAHRTEINNFIYDGKDLTKLPVYRFKAWKGFTPSHVVFGENVGSVPAQAIKNASDHGDQVMPDMRLYKIMNGKDHLPVAGVSDIYAVDFNGDGKIAGMKISDLEKTTIDECIKQRAIRDQEFREFVEKRSYQRSHNRR